MIVHINETLGAKEPIGRAEIASFVQEAKLDLDLWFEYVTSLIVQTNHAVTGNG